MLAPALGRWSRRYLWWLKRVGTIGFTGGREKRATNEFWERCGACRAQKRERERERGDARAWQGGTGREDATKGFLAAWLAPGMICRQQDGMVFPPVAKVTYGPPFQLQQPPCRCGCTGRAGSLATWAKLTHTSLPKNHVGSVVVASHTDLTTI